MSLLTTLLGNVLATNQPLGTPPSGIITNLTGDQLGTTTNDSAAALHVGETKQSVIANGSAVSISATTTAQNMTSVSLTAGSWFVVGNILFTASVGASNLQAWVSDVSATTPDPSLYAALGVGSASFTLNGFCVPPQIFKLSVTTTIYISGLAVFASGTVVMSGGIYAIRFR